MEGFQKYDTTVSKNLTKQDSLQGEKCFDFLLIPRKAGNLQIPSLHFSFFNPERPTISYRYNKPHFWYRLLRARLLLLPQIPLPLMGIK